MSLFSGLLGGISSANTTLTNVEDFFSALLNPDTYVRLFFVVLGFSLIIGAVMYGQ